MSLPNQLTVLRIILTPVFVILLFSESTLIRFISFVVFAVASLTDWYDGYIARKFGIVSKWGKFLDPLADKILISAGLISFCFLGYFTWWMIIIVLVRDVFITIFRSYAIYKGRPIATSYFAKVKTFSQVIFLYFVYIYFLITQGLNIGSYNWIYNSNSTVHLINIVMFFITTITVTSGVLYIIDNRSFLAEMKKDLFKLFIPSNTRV